MISIKVDTAMLTRRLDALAKNEMPFAFAMAINDVLGAISKSEPAALEKELDRPTRFTKSPLYIRRASKRRLSGSAGFKDIQARYLELQATGGTRRKSSKSIAVPVAAKLNKFGNIPRGSLARQIARGTAFKGEVEGVAGIWKKPGEGRSGGIRLLAVLKSATQYKPRLKFQARAAAAAGSQIAPALRSRLAQGLKTRKA